jgi:hypothetical protein
MAEYNSIQAPEAPKRPTSLGGKIGSGILDVLAAKAGVERHPNYSAQMGEYTRRKTDAGNKIKLAGDVESNASQATFRKAQEENLKSQGEERVARAEDRQQAQGDRKMRLSLELAQMNPKVVDPTSPPTPGAVRLEHPLNPGTFIDIVPTKGSTKITDPELARVLRVKPGEEVSQAVYLKGVDLLGELEKAKAPKEEATTPDYKNYLQSKKEGFTGTFEQWQDKDANRKRPVTNITTGGMTNPVANRVQGIASQFDGEPIVKEFSTIKQARNFVRSLGEGKASTPTDDQGLLYAFAKAMDPGSVVREGEYNTVQKYSQSLLENFGVKVERALSNKPFLTEEAKKYLKDTIDKKYRAAESQYKDLHSEYGRRINKAGGIQDGDQYITDYAKSGEGEKPAGGGQQSPSGPGRGSASSSLPPGWSVKIK